MKLIIGLGNPGKQYQKTRHNIGWMVLDLLAEKDKWHESKKAKALYLKKELNSTDVELFKPLTFMNESGRAVAYAVKKHNLKIDDIMVVHDDIDLPVGKIRIGKFDSSAGHKGIQSIIDNLNSADFVRFRIGIKNDKADKQPAEKLVLNKFGFMEKKKINEAIEQAAEAIKMSVNKSLETVMNKYN